MLWRGRKAALDHIAELQAEIERLKAALTVATSKPKTKAKDG